MADLAAFIGYRLRGIRGAIAAAGGFLCPSLGMVLVLSWAYFSYGARPQVHDLVTGLTGLVVGVLAGVTVDFGTEHARGALPAVIALGAFIVGVSGANVLWAVFAAFTVGAVAVRDGTPTDGAPTTAGPASSWRRVMLAAVPGLVVLAGVAVAAHVGGEFGAVTVDMAKIGSISFGNGLVILPVLLQDCLAHRRATSLSSLRSGCR